MATRTAWGGRFDAEPSAVAIRFSASVDVDQRLAREDIQGSIAHARMLGEQGILSHEDVTKILEGLRAIDREIDDGTFRWDPALEDVHMNLEAALRARVGDAGSRLHTARSRNDQVATDMRLWTRAALDLTSARLDRLLSVLVVLAERHLDVLCPGYTHLQRAQPTRLAHHLLAWAAMLERDHGRLHDARRRLNESPLGAGALATTSFPIDRHRTSRELGFDRPMGNSLDAVADRDFLVESVSALATVALHLSRIGEELVLWSTPEFGFVTMSDAFTTGSSMMPQKKNPDMAELVRGKSARVVGDLVTLLVLLKGLPLTYNRDLQEDKPPTFDAFDTVQDCLDVLAGSLATARFHADSMARALEGGHLEATDLADFLVTRGVPFRDAHHVAGALVGQCAREGRTLRTLTDDELRAAHPLLDPSVRALLTPEAMVERRAAHGGPARARVLEAIAAERAALTARGREVAVLAADAGLSDP